MGSAAGFTADIKQYDLALAQWTVQGDSPQGNIEVPATVPGTLSPATWPMYQVHAVVCMYLIFIYKCYVKNIL